MEKGDFKPISDLEQKLEYIFNNKSLLLEAVTLPTYTNNVDGNAPHNQRLEFLGDAVLGMLMADAAFSAFPKANEGMLTRTRADFVSGTALANLAQEIDLKPYLRLDPYTRVSSISYNLACTIEAIFGAIWLDGGLNAVKKIFAKFFLPRLRKYSPISSVTDPKGILQAYIHKMKEANLPKYRIISQEGPPHAPVFTVEVQALNKIATACGSSRKNAEAQAAIEWMQKFATKLSNQT